MQNFPSIPPELTKSAKYQAKNPLFPQEDNSIYFGSDFRPNPSQPWERENQLQLLQQPSSRSSSVATVAARRQVYRVQSVQCPVQWLLGKHLSFSEKYSFPGQNPGSGAVPALLCCSVGTTVWQLFYQITTNWQGRVSQSTLNHHQWVELRNNWLWADLIY